MDTYTHKMVVGVMLGIGILTWRMGAMEEGQGSSSQAPQEETIIFITRDNKQISMPKRAALAFGTIKDLLIDAEKGGATIPLHNVSEASLQRIIAEMGITQQQYEKTLVNRIEDLQSAHYLQYLEMVEKYASEVAKMLTSSEVLALKTENIGIAVLKLIPDLKNTIDNDKSMRGEWVELYNISHEGIIQSIDYSKDGSKIVTTTDKTVKIINAHTGEVIQHIISDVKPVRDAVFSPNGNRVAIAYYDIVKIIDLDTKREITIPDVDWIGVHFSANGNVLFGELPSGGSIQVADANTARVYFTSQGAAVFSKSGNKLVDATSNSTANIIDAYTGRVLKELVDCPCSYAISPDGNKIAAASRMSDGSMKILNANTGEVLIDKKDLADFRFISFSLDNNKIVGSTLVRWNYLISIVNANTGEIIRVFDEIDKREGEHGIFSPDGNRMAIEPQRSTDIVKIVDIVTGNTLFSIAGYETARFSFDGSKVVFLDFPTRSITVVNLATQETQILEAPRERGDEIGRTLSAFSPDGTKLVTSAVHNAAKIWALVPARSFDQRVFIQFLRAAWKNKLQISLSGWVKTVFDTYSPDDQKLIRSTFATVFSNGE